MIKRLYSALSTWSVKFVLHCFMGNLPFISKFHITNVPLLGNVNSNDKDTRGWTPSRVCYAPSHRLKLRESTVRRDLQFFVPNRNGTVHELLVFLMARCFLLLRREGQVTIVRFVNEYLKWMCTWEFT